MADCIVVRTRTGSEDRAAWHLKNQNFEVLLPRYRKQIRHARKTQTVLRPLFPSYLFVCMDMQNQRWRAINGTVGVITLVQFGDAPSPISQSVVDSIRERCDEEGVVNLAPKGLKIGDRVRMRDGAFSDYTALLEEVCDEKRVILLLNLMGREVRITAPIENIAIVS